MSLAGVLCAGLTLGAPAARAAPQPADATDWRDRRTTPPGMTLPLPLRYFPLYPQGRAAMGRLRGVVYQRGSFLKVGDARIRVTGAAGELGTAQTDAKGRFELLLPVGPCEVVITGPRHEPLRLSLRISDGRGAVLEARMVPRREYQLFSSRVLGDPRREGNRFSLFGEEMRTQAGTLGDPFRVIGLLPGVATPLPVAPVYVIRGASPGMNGFYLDGMRVPQLFHILVGGGVVHARLLDWLDFYPGAYDASFGRYAGGIIDTGTRAARDDGYHGEVELRLYDVSAAVEARLPHDVRVTLSGHYGYPGPIVHAIDDRIDLSYWDYQARIDWRGLTVQALGSFDYVNIVQERLRMGVPTRAPNEFRLTFHRVQVRQRGRLGRAEFEAGVVGGIDEMQAFGGQGVRKLSLGLRANVHVRLGWLRIFAGLDGELSRFGGVNFGGEGTAMAPDELGELSTERDGQVGGAFAVLTADLLPRLTATLSGRVDVYHAGQVTLLGLDPRLQLRYKAQDWLTFTAGGGLYQQPPSFPVALPGIDTFALQLGLQRAIHGAVGIEAQLPETVSLALTGYYQSFANANDVVVDLAPLACTSPPPEALSGSIALITRQLRGQSYGMEVLLRRHKGRFTGWIAYTLSRSERVYSCGLRPADFDQTHVLNIVGQVQLPWRLMASARFFYSTGRPATELVLPDWRATVRNNTRLPDYVQLDVRIDREWLFRRFSFSVFLEVVNATYSTVNFGLTYPDLNVNFRPGQGTTTPDLTPSLSGFAWILPSIGLRARF